jgi:hypothetical protein
MKILFIDDCYRKDEEYLGHGGFCIDAVNLRSLASDFSKLKESYGVPDTVELKWSPGKRHPLRRYFKGNRQELYRKAILLLHQHRAEVVCAVHSLRECYGVRLHRWTMKRARLWVTKQQLKFLAERFEQPFLEQNDDVGMIIADHYGDRKVEGAIIEETSLAMVLGTRFQEFERICMLPLMTAAKNCPYLQLADLVIGVAVCSLADSEYAISLFDNLAFMFLKKPHMRTSASSSLYSASVLGFGLKLFPKSFSSTGAKLFKEIDNKYVYTDHGVEERIGKVRQHQ